MSILWKKLSFTLSTTLCCALLLSPAAVSAQQLYVQSQQAKLLSQPRADAPVVALMKRGDNVQVLESNATWNKVRQGAREGWVFRYFLAEHPPLNQVAPALADEVDKEHTRRRASAVVTAGATRGLSPEERERAHMQGFADYNALTEMDKFAPDATHLQHFLQAGIPQ